MRHKSVQRTNLGSGRENEEKMAAVPITLIFGDGVTRTIDVAPGASILEAARASGYKLMVDCCEGTCGTCEAELLTGDVVLDAYDEMTLAAEHRAAGVILPCVSRAQEPATILFPYDYAEVADEDEQPVTGRVNAVTLVAAETVRLEVMLDEPLTFLPGQYVNLGPVGNDYTRCYSMANAPGERRLLFYLRVLPQGRLSRWASEQARPGDELELSAPKGSFFLRVEPRRRIFVAGGTGLAPFLSMLGALAQKPEAEPAHTEILVGARSGEHLFALEELKALAVQVPSVRVHVAVEKGAEGYLTGRPTDLLPDLDINADTRVYLCGPPPMVEVARHAVTAAGVPRREVLCERFN